MRWAALVFGAVIVVSVFLPWVSMDPGFGMRMTWAGTATGWGKLSLIMGVICAGLAFLPIPPSMPPRIRGIGYLVAGGLTVIGVLGYWSALRDALGPVYEQVMGMDVISPGAGLYLCVAGAAGVIVMGIVESRQKRGIGDTRRASRETSCPKCGTLNLPSDKFCASCGAEVQSMLIQKATPISSYCPKCDTENSPDSKFCQSCGSPCLTF